MMSIAKHPALTSNHAQNATLVMHMMLPKENVLLLTTTALLGEMENVKPVLKGSILITIQIVQ